jgi:hypothetical protein
LTTTIRGLLGRPGSVNLRFILFYVNWQEGLYQVHDYIESPRVKGIQGEGPIHIIYSSQY